MLPENDPRITGGRVRYQINDRVNVNCTSGRSKPGVKLTWFINGHHAGPEYVKHYKTLKTGREGLEQTVLGLRFRVKHEHFKHGDMKLKVNEGFKFHCSTANQISFHSVLELSSLFTGKATKKVPWAIITKHPC